MLALLPLAACAARDPYVSTSLTTPSDNWRIERQVDRITGTTLPSALLRTAKSSHSDECGADQRRIPA
jgi:hypothetical protein